MKVRVSFITTDQRLFSNDQQYLDSNDILTYTINRLLNLKDD